MKSVAIVGFYGPTLPYLKQSQAEEVWVPNHGVMVMGEDIPRCTRAFEIHKEKWFRRKELPRFEEYWQWLCQDHPFPIYLQEAIPDIKRGVVYPFEEVCADVFAHLWRKGQGGEEIRDTFLTSSAAFMLALAIHERFERVEIYGIGMETETEYGYQLPGFTYMIGVANGRGIDVVNMDESPICRAQVYAYSAIPYTTLDRLYELRNHYDGKFAESLIASRRVIDAFNSGKSKDQNAAQEASDLAAAHNGAMRALDMLIEQESEYMSRQALEVKKRKFYHDCESYKALTNQLAGQFAELLKKKKHSQVEKVWAQYMDARASMHANSGAVQLLDNLIAECDLLKSKHEIVLTIQDEG